VLCSLGARRNHNLTRAILPLAYTLDPVGCMCRKLCHPSWLDYVSAYAGFHDTSMGHYTWYLVPCNELSLFHAGGLDKWQAMHCQGHSGRCLLGAKAC
jgi:hypothetical protein